MSRFYVVPQAGVGPGGTIVFRQVRSPYGEWEVYVGDARLGRITPAPGGLWDAHSYGAVPNEWFGEINHMEGFGTRFAAAQFVIKHHGYWLREVRERKADRERFAARLKALVLSKPPLIRSESPEVDAS